MNNTDGIYVSDVSGGDATVDIDATDGQFAPGATSEGGAGASEIEFQVDLADGQHDSVRVWGEQAGSKIALGSDGINFNVAAEPLAPDSDISLPNVEDAVVFGSPADDWASGQGDYGTGQPFTQGLLLAGKGGDDELHGGESLDSWLFGGTGDDVLVGGGQMDHVEGGPDDDTIAGGGGWDNASYDASPDSVGCGEGPDSLATDALDTIAPDCTPAPTPPPGSGTTTGSGSTTGAGSTTGSGTTTSTGSGDALGPALTLSVPRQSLRRVRAGGLRAILSCSTACRATARLMADRRTARRLGLGTTAALRTLGRVAPVALAPGTPRTVRVRLTRAATAALRHARAARLVLRARATDDAGHARAPARAAVRLRRAA